MPKPAAQITCKQRIIIFRLCSINRKYSVGWKNVSPNGKYDRALRLIRRAHGTKLLPVGQKNALQVSKMPRRGAQRRAEAASMKPSVHLVFQKLESFPGARSRQSLGCYRQTGRIQSLARSGVHPKAGIPLTGCGRGLQGKTPACNLLLNFTPPFPATALAPALSDGYHITPATVVDAGIDLRLDGVRGPLLDYACASGRGGNHPWRSGNSQAGYWQSGRPFATPDCA